MDLLQLKYFYTVAKLEHMTKAAHSLQIAQPALSMTIARLEEDIGVSLFNRVGRNIVLNEYGKSFFLHVSSALRELETGRQKIAALAESESGTISIASTFTNKYFSNLLSSFSRLHPKVDFRLCHVMDEKEKMNLLERDEVDYVFVIKKFNQSGIVYIPLAEKEIFLAVSRTSPLAGRITVTLAELAEESFINLQADHSIQNFCHTLCEKKGFVPNIVCTCDNPQELINLVSDGLGVAFFPAVDQKRPSFPFALVRIEDFEHKSFLYFAWKSKRYFSKMAVEFRKYILQSHRFDRSK